MIDFHENEVFAEKLFELKGHEPASFIDVLTVAPHSQINVAANFHQLGSVDV